MEHSGVKFTSVSSENETINEGLIPKVGCSCLNGSLFPHSAHFSFGYDSFLIGTRSLYIIDCLSCQYYESSGLNEMC